MSQSCILAFYPFTFHIFYLLLLLSVVAEIRVQKPYMKIGDSRINGSHNEVKTVRFQTTETKSKKYLRKDVDHGNEYKQPLEVVDVEAMQPYCSNHIQESSGNGFCGAFKYVYNAYKEKHVEKRSTPSVHVRCVMCLAIAKQMENHIENVVGGTANTPFDLSADMQNVDSYLSADFCCQAFSKYGMRNCNGVIFLGKASDCGESYPTSYDGRWTHMLKEMCTVFMDQLSPEAKYLLYTGHGSKSIHLEEFLCQGYGLFRECNNVRSAMESHHNCKDEFADCPFWCRFI